MLSAALYPHEAPLVSFLLLKVEEKGPQQPGHVPDLPELAHNHSTGHHYPVTLGTILSDQYHFHLCHSFRRQHRTVKYPYKYLASIPGLHLTHQRHVRAHPHRVFPVLSRQEKHGEPGIHINRPREDC